ncbi:ferredoxin [Micromonospora olivasterospora]|uniref:Ferredoxin n=1 Tax=Micromonospora olivasterospora TaxID=1880 RepID=A0A562I2H0_MICOL|nr:MULTISPECIES: ferredoxin [Micromonospora]PSK65027.1 Ferredoxin-1 [Micromonospora sp. MH33]TWH65239.1 ferredoxin [Micromonospora olivasterospora]
MTRYWRLDVDQDRCIGSGQCTATAPGSFELDDDRLAHPSEALVEPSEDVRSAAHLCPVAAITIDEVAAEH